MSYGPTYSTYNITATGTTGYSAAKDPVQTSSTVVISGTYATVAFTFEATCDGTNWFKVACIDNSTQLPIAGSTTISPTDDSEYSWTIPNAVNYSAIRTNVSSYGSGTAVISVFSSTGLVQPSVTVSATTGTFTNGTFSGTLGVTGAATFASTITGTSTSASALAVGANGATNPVLKVNANTASVATGLTIVGAAAAAGVALTAISSGTNENMTIDAKGSGVLNLNATATGTVYAGRGSLKGPVFGKTLTSIGTSQSSTPTTAQLLGGIVTQTGSTGAGAVTLPTGTAISAAMPLTPVAGDSFTCRFANLGGGQTLTITGDTGSTVIGTATVASATNIDLLFVNTGTNTWNVYTNK